MNQPIKFLSDIKNKISDVVRLETNSFIRSDLIKFVNNKFSEWEQYCKHNDIEIVDEVKAEIDKFIKLIQTESVIESKHINARLVFGDETLESVSNRWKLDYKE